MNPWEKFKCTIPRCAFGTNTQPYLTPFLTGNSSSTILHFQLCKHTISELPPCCYELVWAANLCHTFSKHITTDCIKSSKRCVKSSKRSTFCSWHFSWCCRSIKIMPIVFLSFPSPQKLCLIMLFIQTTQQNSCKCFPNTRPYGCRSLVDFLSVCIGGLFMHLWTLQWDCLFFQYTVNNSVGLSAIGWSSASTSGMGFHHIALIPDL